MHETRSLDFLTASTVRILHLKYWALDSCFFDRKSAVLVCRAARGSDAELRAMESEQFSLSLPPSPGRHPANSTVQFSHGYLAPSPEAQGAVSFGLEDILYTAASDFRTSETRHSTFFRLAARRHSLLRPILNSGTFFHAPLRIFFYLVMGVLRPRTYLIFSVIVYMII